MLIVQIIVLHFVQFALCPTTGYRLQASLHRLGFVLHLLLTDLVYIFEFFLHLFLLYQYNILYTKNFYLYI